jgi:hypothetical protein
MLLLLLFLPRRTGDKFECWVESANRNSKIRFFSQILWAIENNKKILNSKLRIRNLLLRRKKPEIAHILVFVHKFALHVHIIHASLNGQDLPFFLAVLNVYIK